MKTMTRKKVFSGALLLALTLVMVMGVFFMNPMKASAATNRAGVYTISGTYNIGDGNKSGYLSDFRITIATQYFTDDSATVAQTKYHDHTYNWTYFSFYIYANDIDSHTSFKLTRNGSTYTSKSLSGDGSGYLYQGALSDGDYVLTYVGTYWDGIFSKKTYTFTYRFTVDTTSPSVSLKANGSAISSGSYTNKAIAFSASDSYSSTKIYYRSPSSSSYTYTTSSSKSVSATSSNNGWWYFYATDGYQSTSTYSVYLDTVAPVGKVTNSSGTTISNGGYTNKPVKYTATDTGGVFYYQVKNPGSSSWSSYTSGTALSASTGWYTFRAVDKAGNTSSEYKVYYDATAPYGYVYGGTTSKASGSYTNASYVKYAAYDSHSGVKNIYVLKPGASSYVAYTSGTQLTAEGTYYFYCVDNSGNQSTVMNITLDKTAPTGTLYGGTATKTSGSYTNASYVKYVASDSRSGVNNVYVKMPNASSYTAYSSGTQLATQGTYSFYCTDKAGNQSSVVTITLDTTKPTGTLYAGSSTIQSGDSTNASYVKFVPTDNISLANIYVKKPNSTSYVAYTSGTQLTAEGAYSFYCTDKAGNQSATYTVTVNRQIPTAQLYVDGKTIGNGSYTNGEYISFKCAETCYVKIPGATAFSDYVSGTEYSKTGMYVFYGVDEAGNSTGNYTIIIDRTAKTATLSGVTSGKTNGDVTVSWTNGNSNTYAPIRSVTVNGKSISNGTVLHTIDTGVYEVVVTDAAGNKWNTTFASTKQNVVTSTLQKEYFEVKDADGNIFSFATYDNALAFATLRENGLVVKGTWESSTWDTGVAMDAKDSVNAKNGEYFIYKKSGSPSEQVAYFTLERLNEVIAEYAELGIENYFYWEKTPAAPAEGENLYFDSKTILANKVELGENVGCLIDGEEFVGTVIEVEGEHIITLFDDWGNTCDYTATIVRTTPSIQYAIGEGASNNASYDRTFYFKDAVNVSITDTLDEFAMFKIFRIVDEEAELIGTKSVGEVYAITESGTYRVVAVNHAGDSESFDLIVSRNAPTVSLTEDNDAKQLVITITESSDVESNLQTLIIEKSTDNGATWVEVEVDDYGTIVELDNLVYKFRTTAMYRVTVTDEFRTGIDAITGNVKYVQLAPTGELEGVTNGGFTNSEVEFTWKDEAIVTVTKNGEVIEYKSGKKLTEDGVYTITIANHDGHKTVYEFTIDTVKPEITLAGATEEAPTNTDVTVTFTENGATATISKNGGDAAPYTSGTPVTEDGSYTVVVTDKAGNVSKTSFAIDKTVDFKVNVNNGGLANSVTVTENEKLEIIVTKNGDVIEYKGGNAITEPADYTVKLTDKLGNTAEVKFTIVEPLVQKFDREIDSIPNFEKVLVNGTEITLDRGALVLAEDGTYEVSIVAGGVANTFTVTVDATAPTLTLNGVENDGTTTEGVIISDVTDGTVKVFLNDEEIEYTVGDELSEVGEYKVIVTDECGNAAEYSFTIEKGANIGIIILIIVIVLAAIGGGVFFYIKKKNSL